MATSLTCEALCPVDMRQSGLLIDDELNEILVQPLPAGVLGSLVPQPLGGPNLKNSSCEVHENIKFQQDFHGRMVF